MARILILSEEFGSGHERAAIAIKKGLELVAPGAQVSIINFFKYFQPQLSKMTLKLYLKSLHLRPEIWGYLYEKDRNNREITLAKKVFQIAASYVLREIVEQKKPDAIICTHPFPCIAASRLKSKGLNVPLVAVITDFDVHGFWVNEYVDSYIVANEFLKKTLVEFGIPSQSVYPTGIPIDPAFDKFIDKKDVKRRLGFNDELPLILTTGGGFGLNCIDNNTLNSLSSDCIQIAVICGSNVSNRKKLEDIYRRFKNIKIYGFINNMWDYMSAADLLVTKPGGLTMAEALVKGLPTIIYNPLPGQEERNAIFFIKNGVAKRARNQEQLHGLVPKLINDTEKLMKMRKKAESLKKTHSAEKAAYIVMDLLGYQSLAVSHGRVI